MICPHCKKAIEWKVSEETKVRARELKALDARYSVRDIEKILRDEGHHISYPTIARILKEGSE